MVHPYYFVCKTPFCLYLVLKIVHWKEKQGWIHQKPWLWISTHNYKALISVSIFERCLKWETAQQIISKCTSNGTSPTLWTITKIPFILKVSKTNAENDGTFSSLWRWEMRPKWAHHLKKCSGLLSIVFNNYYKLNNPFMELSSNWIFFSPLNYIFSCGSIHLKNFMGFKSGSWLLGMILKTLNGWTKSHIKREKITKHTSKGS